MAYQSLKRVLGETHLERKCRFLFGASLLLLISGSFWWYGSRAEQVVYELNRRAGRDCVDSILLKYHWSQWDNSKGQVSTQGSAPLVHQTIRDLQSQSYDWEVLALEPPPKKIALDDKNQKQVHVASGWEREVLLELKRQQEEQEDQANKAADGLAAGKLAGSSNPARPDGTRGSAENTGMAIPKTNPSLGHDSKSVLTAQETISPVYRDNWARENGEYHYYQPIYWKRSCTVCHVSDSRVGAVAASEAIDDGESSLPFRVVKVILPDKDTQTAINQNRAFLIATAIGTVFLAMVALYVIVRYVIVKPLKHLRDVSDAIGRGNINLRADIHTNDEFEELAASFNRMLRHLVDAQQELRDVNTDLDGKVDQLAQANMSLYEMNRLKGDFLANMSHELRTPLNSIIGFSDVLSGISALNDKQKRYVVNIQKSGRTLLDMINDILDLAKLESGKMELRLSEFSIETIINAQCDMVRSLVEEKNLDLTISIAPDLPPLFQDQSKVQQILTNLLSNAIKFTPDGGRITVSAGGIEREGLKITVADTGVGIAEEDRETIFEKFRQGTVVQGKNNLTREYSGTGLGLSIIKELCVLLGGEITFVSELGKGSAFTVHLPWRCAEPPPSESKIASKLDELTKPRWSDIQQKLDGVPLLAQTAQAQVSEPTK